MRIFWCLVFFCFQWVVALPTRSTTSTNLKVEPGELQQQSNFIIKGNVDPANYRLIKLKNGLKVLLISDERAKLATASLSVKAGYFQDPENFAGIAHLLEHMMSKGSTRFPSSAAYRKYIGNVGGNSNASTSGQVTNYYFYVPEDAFEGALDRFAAQFESPLLSVQQMLKERHIIDAEFSLKFNDSYRRNREVMRLTIAQDHPYRKFSTGNLQTLQDTKETQLHQAVLDYYHRNYGSENMALILHSAKSLTQMSQLAEKYFSSIKNRNNPAKNVAIIPVTEKHKKLLVKIRPNIAQRRLIMNFIVPGQTSKQGVGMAEFFIWLFENKQTGGLQYQLQHQGLIHSLIAYRESIDDRHDFFNIELRLTSKGLQSIDHILSTAYDYLSFINSHGLSIHQYTIFKKLMDKKFHQNEALLSMEKIRLLSQRLLQNYSTKVSTRTIPMQNFSQERLQNFARQLSSENLRVIINHKQFTPKNIEPNYKTYYKISSLQWRKDNNIEHKFQLPKESPFLGKDDKTPDQRFSSTIKKLTSSRFIQWYLPPEKTDSQFSGITLFVDSASAVSSEKNRILNELWITRLDEQLKQLQQLAEWALVDLYVNTTVSGFHVTMTSQNRLQASLLESVLEELVVPRLPPQKMLSTYYQQKLRYKTLKNTRIKEIIEQRQNEILKVVPKNTYARHFLDHVSSESYQKFLARYLKKARITSIFYGNFSSKQFEDMNLKIKKKVASRIRIPWKVPLIKPKWPSQPLSSEIEIDHQDSAISVILRSKHDNIASEAKIRLLANLLRAPFFHQFRTVKQLGYSIAVNHQMVLNDSYLNFFIQSSNAGTDQLLNEIKRFKQGYLPQLKLLNEEEFDFIKRQVLIKYQARIQTEEQAFELAKINIRDRKSVDYEQKVSNAIKQLSVDELYQFASELLSEKHTISLQIAASGE